MDATFLYIGGWRGVLFGSASRLGILLRVFFFAFKPFLLCYFPFLFWFVLGYFVRFWSLIDLAPQVPFGGLYSGWFYCFARCPILVPNGRLCCSRSCAARSPIWPRSLFSVCSVTIMVWDCNALHYPRLGPSRVVWFVCIQIGHDLRGGRRLGQFCRTDFWYYVSSSEGNDMLVYDIDVFRLWRL